jgi:hypothetical protein
MGNSLIVLGLLLVIMGVGINLFSRLGFPKLPGDILIQRENMTINIPIMTSIILSLVLTIIFWIFRR